MRWLRDLLGRGGPRDGRERARDRPGPLTSREAWDLVAPRLEELDPEARLVGISSGTDLDAGGRASTWSFRVQLPSHERAGLVLVEPAPGTPLPEEAPLDRVELYRPLDAADRGRRALPRDFRDSPEVVAALAAQGVDFVAGPTTLMIETAWSEDDPPELGWVCRSYDDVVFTGY